MCIQSWAFFPARKTERLAAAEALERLGMLDFKDRIYKELSGGERQQIVIARAIATKPDVVLFDEPMAHLDFANQLKVLRIIKALGNQGFTVAVTTHDPNHAILLGGKAAILNDKGKLKSGDASEILTEENLRSVYGNSLNLIYTEEYKRNVCIFSDL